MICLMGCSGNTWRGIEPITIQNWNEYFQIQSLNWLPFLKVYLLVLLNMFIRSHSSEAKIKSDDWHVVKQFATWHQPINVHLWRQKIFFRSCSSSDFRIDYHQCLCKLDLQVHMNATKHTFLYIRHILFW